MTSNIIVVFPRLDDAKNVKNILVRNGMNVVSVCNTGAAALAAADGLGSGIIISAYKLQDMMCYEMYECMPGGFKMLLVASKDKLKEAEYSDIIRLAMPFVVSDLIETVDMMCRTSAVRRGTLRTKARNRSIEDDRILSLAKDLLMERNGFAENEAHRFIQKCSMDSGTNLIESARMVLSMYKD